MESRRGLLLESELLKKSIGEKVQVRGHEGYNDCDFKNHSNLETIGNSADHVVCDVEYC